MKLTNEINFPKHEQVSGATGRRRNSDGEQRVPARKDGGSSLRIA